MKPIKDKTFLVQSVFFVLIVLFGVIAGYVWFSKSETHAKRMRERLGDMEELSGIQDQLHQARYSVEVITTHPGPGSIADALRRISAFRRAVNLLEFARNSEEAVSLRSTTQKIHSLILHAERLGRTPGDPGAKFDLRETSALLLEQLSAGADQLSALETLARKNFIALTGEPLVAAKTVLNLMILFFITAAAALIAGAVLIRRHVMLALMTLRDGTKELRTGNLDYRFREITPDEVGQVKYDINMMARRIEIQANELKNANLELTQRAENLIEANQHKDRFLANMSHELRTPLNSIIGFSELIQQRAGCLDKEKETSYSQRILTAAEHLLGLITSLLDLAKSGAGTLQPVFTGFDLSQSIREMYDLLTPMAAKKGLKTDAVIEPGIFAVADARMVRQIFLNLFSNAIKYTLEGSIQIHVFVRPDADDVVIEVRDTGIGIPEEEHKNMFQDFHRVDNGPGFVVDGVGIGLALSRRLAILHGGAISFESEAGKGSVFRLTIPRNAADASPESEPGEAIKTPESKTDHAHPSTDHGTKK